MKETLQTPDFIALAPMEGIVDANLRYMLSAIGGIDRCVTEFIRITNSLLPPKVFQRYFPELADGSMTHSGVDVYAQILGDNPESMAENAQALAEQGAKGIDINFGCPAKTVNSHGGGSFLLQTPDKVERIIATIRDRVPGDIPVTAKIRLGYHDKSQLQDLICAIGNSGADELTVHARTKVEGYKPPAHWHYIADMVDRLPMPVTANGEIWTLDDLHNCITLSKTRRIMIGRGLVACPDLALMAKEGASQPLAWPDICLLLLHYAELLDQTCPEKYRANLVKQWLIYLRNRFGEAYLFFDHAKRIRDFTIMKDELVSELMRKTANQAPRLRLGNLDLTKTYHSL